MRLATTRRQYQRRLASGREPATLNKVCRRTNNAVPTPEIVRHRKRTPLQHPRRLTSGRDPATPRVFVTTPERATRNKLRCSKRTRNGEEDSPQHEDVQHRRGLAAGRGRTTPKRARHSTQIAGHRRRLTISNNSVPTPKQVRHNKRLRNTTP